MSGSLCISLQSRQGCGNDGDAKLGLAREEDRYQSFKERSKFRFAEANDGFGPRKGCPSDATLFGTARVAPRSSHITRSG